MGTFSQRQHIKPTKSVIQIDNIDQELRNRLWNLLDVIYWVHAAPYQVMSTPSNRDYWLLTTSLWHNFFKEPIDTIPGNWNDTWQILRKFFFACKWNEVYDLIEFVAINFSQTGKNEAFIIACNDVLKSEVSGYRFINGIIAPITSEEEIAEIEEALKVAQPSGVILHLTSALEKLSDKKEPDYRNSIKESISAVESISALIAGNPKATLGDALKEIRREAKIAIHPALNDAFDKLYGYTSDADGIRHKIMDATNLDFEDAKFMLVACSAFINYLKVKALKAGISFNS